MSAGTSELPAFAADFRVGDWLVEPSLDRLSRNGTVLHLRPQLTNLLVLLARRAGHTVSKEEILSTVWDGQFVAESGMTRCVAEIRQALGDDARDPRILETIPKRGYRLVAPVTFLDREQAEPAAAATAGEAGTSAALAAVTAATAAAAEAGSPRPEIPPAPGKRPLTASAMPGPSAPRWAGLTLAALAGVGLVLVLAWSLVGWSRPSVLSGRETVVLADVNNTTGDPAFDQTLRLALAVQLGQAPFLRILPDSRTRAALLLMGREPGTPVTGATALEVCTREGGAVLLATSVARVGSHYAVGLEAFGCATGESLARQFHEVESKDDVLAALGAAAGRIRRELGESRSSLRQHDVPIVQATTPSLDALEALSLGDLNRERSKLEDALLFYRRATELDPQFALAWARRGAAARNLGQVFGDERPVEPAETLLSFRRAYELRDRVSEPERFYILGHYHRFVTGEADKAIDAYTTWSRAYPGADIPPTNLASLYVSTLGQYDRALEPAREAVKLAPASSIANQALITAYLGTGQPGGAKRALADAFGAGADSLGLRRTAFELALAENDAAAMREHLRRASDDPLLTLVMIQSQALAAASKGRLREARRLWSEAETAAANVGLASARVSVWLRQAEAEALLGDAGAARAEAEAAVALDPGEGTQLAAAAVLALARDPLRAGHLVDAVGWRLETDASMSFVWQPVVRALVAAGSGRLDQAVQSIARARRFERGRNFGLMPLGVRASIDLSAGHALEAAAAFHDLIQLAPVRPTSPWVPYARLGLARALRDGGDVTRSRAAYDAVLEWMRGADRDAPILVAARRERAALPSR